MPWLGTLLATTGAALGRLVAVNLLPTAVLAAVVALTLRADAFSARTRGLQWADLVLGFKVDSGGVLLLIVALFALAALLQPFEIAAVRLLEGYWGVTSARVAVLLAWRHRNRVRKADRRIKEERDLRRRQRQEAKAGGPGPLTVQEQVRRRKEEAVVGRRAGWGHRVRPQYPPDPGEVMPTMLGNVLRTAERRAGERYHLPTVPALPRLHAQLPDRLAMRYNAAVDTLDAAATMAIATALGAAVSAGAFWDDPALRWVPGLLLVLSLVSYRGAVVAAGQHGTFMDIAFDLHRFDLLKALHLDLPADTAQEEALGRKVTAFLGSADLTSARQIWKGTAYWHYEEHGRPDTSSATVDDERAQQTGHL